jgi:hypothetical protein
MNRKEIVERVKFLRRKATDANLTALFESQLDELDRYMTLGDKMLPATAKVLVSMEDLMNDIISKQPKLPK